MTAQMRPPVMVPAELYCDGCGGRPEKAELLTGIEGASSRPMRRIVLPVRAVGDVNALQTEIQPWFGVQLVGFGRSMQPGNWAGASMAG